jgi:hypothetical protein
MLRVNATQPLILVRLDSSAAVLFNRTQRKIRMKWIVSRTPSRERTFEAPRCALQATNLNRRLDAEVKEVRQKP